MSTKPKRDVTILVSVAFLAILIASLIYQRWSANSRAEDYSCDLVRAARNSGIAIVRERFIRLRNHAVAGAEIPAVSRLLGLVRNLDDPAPSNRSPSSRSSNLSAADFGTQLDDEIQTLLDDFGKGKGGDAEWFSGWCLMELDGRVLASSDRRQLDHRWPIGNKALQRIIALESLVVPAMKSPVADTDLVNGTSNKPAGLSLAPIVKNGVAIAVLGWMFDPDVAIQPVLDEARFGDTGLVYLFDSGGSLLTRLDAGPSGAELDPNSTRVGIDRRLRPLNKPSSIRDVGLQKTSALANGSSLTFAVDQAMRGGTGIKLDGYEGNDGTQVVGAYTWLDDLELGLVAEVERQELFPPSQWTLVYWILVVSIVIFTLAKLSSILRSLTGDPRIKSDSQQAVRRLGQYELHEVIGSGGMGDVYRGTHHLLNRPVAVKVLEGRDLTSQAISRFEREVQVTASLRHPNTVAVYDYGKADGHTLYYVMEHVNGISLQQLVDSFGSQPAARVIHLLLQICSSLSEAHRRQLVHRDIKPANVLISGEPGVWDFVKVVDFGLIKSLELRESTETLTRSDTVTGTPMYMPPECVRDAGMANAQSDIYSIGAVGYVLLAGVPLFEGDNSVDICSKQLHQDPLRPSDRIGRDLPDDLQNVLMSCLRKDPVERPRSVDDLAATLRSCVDVVSWNEGDAMDWWQNEFTQANLSHREMSKGTTEDGTLVSHSVDQ